MIKVVNQGYLVRVRMHQDHHLFYMNQVILQILSSGVAAG